MASAPGFSSRTAIITATGTLQARNSAACASGEITVVSASSVTQQASVTATDIAGSPGRACTSQATSASTNGSS